MNKEQTIFSFINLMSVVMVFIISIVKGDINLFVSAFIFYNVTLIYMGVYKNWEYKKKQIEKSTEETIKNLCTDCQKRYWELKAEAKQ